MARMMKESTWICLEGIFHVVFMLAAAIVMSLCQKDFHQVFGVLCIAWAVLTLAMIVLKPYVVKNDAESDAGATGPLLPS